MRVLIGCEYSGVVREAFAARGHDAWSVDLLPTDMAGQHYQGSILDCEHYLGPLESFDLMIAHPPCTYLTGAAEWAYADIPMINGKPRNIKPDTLIGAERRQAREEALLFVDRLWGAPIKRICIENPVGVIPKNRPLMPKPQYVQQYWFGEDASKKTGLYLKGLPPLKPTKRIPPRMVCRECGFNQPYENAFSCGCSKCGAESGLLQPRWSNQTDSGQNKLPPSKDRWKIRSITPRGLAAAMAEQWG